METGLTPSSPSTLPSAPRPKSAKLPEELSPILNPDNALPESSAALPENYDWYDSMLASGLSPDPVSQFYGNNLDLYGVNVPLDHLGGASTSELFDRNQEHRNDSIPNVPMIDGRVPISSLRKEYEGGSISFVKQIDWLANNGFGHIRRSRGDGNCFYRCVGFAYVERILQAANTHGPEIAATSLSVLESTIPMLEQAGFKESYLEFYEPFAVLLQQIAQPGVYGELTPQALLEAFQSREVSDSIVFFLRLLTSAQINANPDSFLPYLIHPETHIPISLEDFCGTVIVLGHEADHVEILALCNALKIRVEIAYLDGKNPDGEVNFIPIIPEETATEPEGNPLRLLYRPGHYDMLIKSGKEKQLLD